MIITLTLLAISAALPSWHISDHVNEMESFTHESCPGYQLDSVDPSSLGLDKVKQQSGYLKTPSGNRLFYWFFESRSDPKTDPVVVWLNGGPGCSSLEAVLFENGPSNINDNGEINHNPWSWNNNANVLYIDNPSGVGYSTGGATVTDTVTASEDFKNAVLLFFQQHPEFAHSSFHIAGESYAGRYIPVFASAINSYKDSLVEVSSIMIGNGLVDPVAEYSSYEPMLCGQGGFNSALSPEQCEILQNETPACTSAMNRCMNTLGRQCVAAQLQCSGLQRAFTGRNPYDIRDSSCPRTNTGLCYPGLDVVQNYFNEPSVRQALGVDDGNQEQNYQVCNNQINSAFYRNEDPFAPTYKNITSLLQQGTAVLVYHGDADIILNWLGGREWTKNLAWNGQAGFQNAALSPTQWKPTESGKRGEITNFENFTFLRVHGAGHMVPHDQAESAYYMVHSWLSKDYAFKRTYNQERTR